MASVDETGNSLSLALKMVKLGDLEALSGLYMKGFDVKANYRILLSWAEESGWEHIGVWLRAITGH